MARYDLIVRNATTVEFNGAVDIGVRDGVIESIGSVGGDAETVVDADGQFVSPGLVDPHKHIDRALAAEGGERPAGNDGPFDMARSLANEHDYYAAISTEELRRNCARDLEMAVSHGSTYVRSYVTVDDDVRGLDNVRAAAAAREAMSDVVDLQLVAGWRSDATRANSSLLREAIDIAKTDAVRNPALLGGSDSGNTGDLDGTIDRWFDIATDADVGIDLHVNSPGMLGAFTLDRLMDRVEAHGYGGWVTATHGYGLAQMPEWRAEQIIDRAAAVGLAFTTCYNSVRHGMPLKTMLAHDGLTVGHGTDNDRDFVLPHGNANQLEAMLVLINKLHGAAELADPDAEYRWLESNEGLRSLWSMVTYGGAAVMGIAGEYGIAEGNPANLAVFESGSPEWAIIDGDDPSHVIKDGQVVARDGRVLPTFSIDG